MNLSHEATPPVARSGNRSFGCRSLAAWVTAFSIFAAGCGGSKSANSTGESKTVAPEPKTEAKPGVTETKSPPSPVRIASVAVPPLDPAVAAMLETNKTAMVEHRIHAVTNAELSSLQKAQVLLRLFEEVDAEGQRKVAHEVAAQVEDSRYPLIREKFIDGKVGPQVLSVFMTDTLKRPNYIRLPILLELAQLDGHPSQAEAQELLRSFVPTNYGTNWPKWEQAISALIATGN